MPPTVYELMVTAIEGPQTCVSGRRVTSFGQQHTLTSLTVRALMEKKWNTTRIIEKLIYSERRRLSKSCCWRFNTFHTLKDDGVSKVDQLRDSGREDNKRRRKVGSSLPSGTSWHPWSHQIYFDLLLFKWPSKITKFLVPRLMALLTTQDSQWTYSVTFRRVRATIL